MLNMICIGEEKECSIEIDYYVPFMIEIKEEHSYMKENKIYWIAGNSKDSLLEIGIGEKSGELKSITLTATTNVTTECIEFNPQKTIEGNPIFDISNLNHTLNNEGSNFKVVLTENSILVLFDTLCNVETLVNMYRVDIGFGTANDIALIKVNNLTSKEYNDLKDSFKLK